MDKKKKYTSAEKKAYYVGLGAAISHGKFGRIKDIMQKLSPSVKTSFGNGLNDGYVKKNMKKLSDYDIDSIF